MARYRLEPGPIPLHHQVYLDLSAALDAGEWRPGDRLPPERELATSYGCSLITVRHALEELVRQGRLERTRGRGTFVKPPRIVHDLTATSSFSDEMRRRGLEPSTRLVAARTEPASEAVALGLGLLPGTPVHVIERLRCASGTPLMLERAHLRAERFPKLLAVDFERASLYGVLTDHYGVQIGTAQETIEAILLPTREARLLEARPRSAALLLEGVTLSTTGVPIEFTWTHVPGERSRFLIQTSGMRTRALVPLASQSWGAPQEAGDALVRPAAAASGQGAGGGR